MFKTLTEKNQTIWFDEALLAEDPMQCFDADFWQRQDKVLGSATGRGTTWFVDGEKCSAALRHYRRGGLFGKLVKDHYWFQGWEKTRSYQEFQLLNTLIKAGVNVPKPIAARAVKRTFCYQADLLSERIPNARDLVSILQERALSAEMYRKIGQEIRKMHDVQVNHTDLNIHNILIDDQEKVWIIDFDKCFQQNGDSWKQSNLKRLTRSFEKEVGKRNLQYRENDMSNVLIGYKSK
ncbi:3-deoxy-D-manno-octulosonic acid kinase [Vibrio plantisponsor]|uniref:3-deoxy-D-manno-octulosonic acid kinase n=1 Tax=Vibrio plantisponsor TaxID=664643 RepID=A0ABU4IID8_9VIBR|nr:3-deoxy-D-manno-octulosonic acid kinase [Vibrio plantisponsor]MDW6018328.1 3-deoxy-D-manno-octulosonic acid kinase [Vibrio plantisponsor]NNM41867.1 3-deoxy-D-manno-octulosonic acid kinase [Vibrio plantisponsor]